MAGNKKKAEPPAPPEPNRKDRSSPAWDTRRKRLDLSLVTTLVLIAGSILKGPETAAAVAPPAFIFAGGILSAYFGIVEWGRIKAQQPKGDGEAK